MRQLLTGDDGAQTVSSGTRGGFRHLTRNRPSDWQTTRSPMFLPNVLGWLHIETMTARPRDDSRVLADLRSTCARAGLPIAPGGSTHTDLADDAAVARRHRRRRSRPRDCPPQARRRATACRLDHPTISLQRSQPGFNATGKISPSRERTGDCAPKKMRDVSAFESVVCVDDARAKAEILPSVERRTYRPAVSFRRR